MLETTYKSAANDNGPPIGSQSAGNLPNVDEKHGELEDRPPSKLLTPRRPELAAERVQDQINHLPDADALLVDAELGGQGLDGAGEHRRVVVHGDLDSGDGAEVHPLLPRRPGVCKDLGAVDLSQLPSTLGVCRPATLTAAFAADLLFELGILGARGRVPIWASDLILLDVDGIAVVIWGGGMHG